LTTTVNVMFVVGVPVVGDPEWPMTDRTCALQLPAAATRWIAPDSGRAAGTISQLAAIRIAASAVNRTVMPRACTDVFVIRLPKPTAAPGAP
jgi:hypothetical protein